MPAFAYVAEVLHLLQDPVHLRHYVGSANMDGGVGPVPESRVENSAALTRRKLQELGSIERAMSLFR